MILKCTLVSASSVTFSCLLIGVTMIRVLWKVECCSNLGLSILGDNKFVYNRRPKSKSVPIALHTRFRIQCAPTPPSSEIHQPRPVVHLRSGVVSRFLRRILPFISTLRPAPLSALSPYPSRIPLFARLSIRISSSRFSAAIWALRPSTASFQHAMLWLRHHADARTSSEDHFLSGTTCPD